MKRIKTGGKSYECYDVPATFDPDAFGKAIRAFFANSRHGAALIAQAHASIKPKAKSAKAGR